MFQWLRKPQQTQHQRLSERTDFPTGLVVEAEGNYYFIKKGTRIRLPTQRVFESWGLPAIPVEKSAVQHMPIAGRFGFRDGSLICNYADGKMYLVSGNKRRLITSPDVFDTYGLSEEDVFSVSLDEIKLQEEGDPLG